MNKGIAIHLLVLNCVTGSQRKRWITGMCRWRKAVPAKKTTKKVLLEGWTAAQTQRKKACLSLHPGGAEEMAELPQSLLCNCCRAGAKPETRESYWLLIHPTIKGKLFNCSSVFPIMGSCSAASAFYKVSSRQRTFLHVQVLIWSLSSH